MDERASEVFIMERARESEEETEGAREGGSGGIGPGRVRAALRKDKGDDKASRRRSPIMSDPEIKKVGHRRKF